MWQQLHMHTAAFADKYGQLSERLMNTKLHVALAAAVLALSACTQHNDTQGEAAEAAAAANQAADATATAAQESAGAAAAATDAAAERGGAAMENAADATANAAHACDFTP